MVESGLMIRRATFRVNRRRGAVAVVVTICLIPLIGAMAFAIDGGFMLAARRRSQTVADAAAYAAACQLYTNLSTDPTGLDVSGKAHTAGFSNASANGFTNDGSTNIVKVNIPPSTLSKLWQTKPGYAEVVVTYNQPRIFGAIFGSGTIPVSARAVARSITSTPQAYSNASIITLSSNAGSSLLVSGGARLTTQSTIQVDSSNVQAAVVSGGANLTASGIDITGNYLANGGATVNVTGGGGVKTAAASVPDPLANLPAPDPTTLTSRSFTSTYGSATISPGVYTGGLSIGGGMVITMLPGVYYMKSGGFTAGGGTTINGSGVTIYIDDGGGSLNLSGGTNVNLTPPTSGTYAGLTYFQDRNSTKPLNLSGGSANSISGTIYAAGAQAQLSGGSNSKVGSQFIVNSLNVSGGANVNINTTNDAKLGYVASGSSSKSLTIVE